MLDRQLAANGEDVLLSRTSAGAVAEVWCRAKVRRGDGTTSDGPFNQRQNDVHVVMSPTQINEAGWPGAAPRRGFDPRLPANPDTIVIDGHTRTVITGRGIYMANQLVRIVLEAR